MTSLTTIPFLAIGLAVLASVAFAVAAVLQHRAVAAQSDDADGDALSLRGMREVSRRPGWLLGLGLAAGGSTIHAIALVLAPLSVVQPVGVLAVPIAVVLTAARSRTRPATGVLVGVAVCVAGVALFVGTAAGTAVSTPAPNGATLFAGVVVAGIVLVLAGLGYARSGWVRCVACAMAGAVAFGLVSALVRAVSQTVTSGESQVLDPAVIAAVFGIVAAVTCRRLAGAAGLRVRATRGRGRLPHRRRPDRRRAARRRVARGGCSDARRYLDPADRRGARRHGGCRRAGPAPSRRRGTQRSGARRASLRPPAPPVTPAPRVPLSSRGPLP